MNAVLPPRQSTDPSAAVFVALAMKSVKKVSAPRTTPTRNASARPAIPSHPAAKPIPTACVRASSQVADFASRGVLRVLASRRAERTSAVRQAASARSTPAVVVLCVCRSVFTTSVKNWEKTASRLRHSHGPQVAARRSLIPRTDPSLKRSHSGGGATRRSLFFLSGSPDPAHSRRHPLLVHRVYWRQLLDATSNSVSSSSG